MRDLVRGNSLADTHGKKNHFQEKIGKYGEHRHSVKSVLPIGILKLFNYGTIHIFNPGSLSDFLFHALHIGFFSIGRTV